MPVAVEQMTVAVTGITGTVGRGLLPLLEQDPRIARVIGVSTGARRGGSFSKLERRQADVAEPAAIGPALKGADVVVHLAFSLYGLWQDENSLRRVNVEGPRNVLLAAAEAGASRFIYLSSATVYGFARERPVLVDERTPMEPKTRHFYSRHKVEAERVLRAELERLPEIDWVFFRPCAVVGPHAVGAASHFLPTELTRVLAALVSVAGAAGGRPPIPAPPVPLQFVHESDVGQAITRAIDGPSDAIYNLAGVGLVEPAQIPRLLGLRRLPLPAPLSRAAVEMAARLPYAVPALGWLQMLSHPLELDTRAAREELGWEPQFSSAEALASTRRALGL